MFIKKSEFILFLVSVFITLLSIENSIFWDNITFISNMGNALYENGVFNWMSITPEIDPGHPPFMAVLVALTWTIFGKSLWITHLIMFPFVFGFLIQLNLFIDYFVKDKSLKLGAFILVLIDPTLLAQLVSINPEVPILCFFFLALNGILYENKINKFCGLVFLSIISYRGMMLGVGLFMVDLLLHIFYRKERFRSFFNGKNLITYILSAIPALCYIGWRLIYKGWIISNPLQPWGKATDYSDKSGFLLNFFRNIAVLIHRYLDFGRISVILLILFYFIFRRNRINFSRIGPLLIIALFSVIVIVMTSLGINNPMGHRYFIPSYLCLALISFILLFHTHTHLQVQATKAKSSQWIVYTFLIVSLLGGNFWIYPDKISQGWDASLAHVHYFDLRHQAISYIEDSGIKIEQTATYFPNNTTIDAVDLNGDKRSFANFTGVEPYVLYSNVYNIKDLEYYTIQNEYRLLKSFKQMGVRVELWARK